jgi:Mrp family chromosome partitioning ATPase
MSSLDRAFIKAFSDVPSPAIVVENRVDRPTEPSPASVSRPMMQQVTSGLRVAQETVGAGLHRPRGGEKSPLAPLSTFAPVQQQAAFRPALEVDHFSWPESCDTLLDRAQDSWSSFADMVGASIEDGHDCIALCSCHRGEGRTSVTLAAAKLLAERGLSIVVVDGDFDRPHLADHCGVAAQNGWGEVLDGELSLGESLIQAVEDGVTLMPWCGARMTATQRANTLRIAATFSTLREHYDLILLDAGPLDGSETISAFAALAKAAAVDGAYMIYDARSTDGEMLTATCDQLRSAGVHVQALIENFSTHGLEAEKSQTQADPAASLWEHVKQSTRAFIQQIAPYPSAGASI